MPRPIEAIWPGVALAFRGYNVANLGRTAELRAAPPYRPIVDRRLRAASRACSEVVGRKIDLVARVRDGREPTLDEYAEAVALVFAVELAQLDLLRVVHGVDSGTAGVSFGYSLGELVALAASGTLQIDEALRVPLAMAGDCAALAPGVRMGVLFSRDAPVSEPATLALCDRINQSGQAMVGVSAVLSPNTLLLLGQGDTLDRVRDRLPLLGAGRIHLRLNDSRWPPLHTPIVWQAGVADRASLWIQRLAVSGERPRPPVLSLVTGRPAPKDFAVRGLLRQWVDHPQRLWDAVCAVLRSGARTVVHVGPAPNVIPATFNRLSDNVRQATARRDLSGLGARAVGAIAQRRWLAARLPKSTALMRAPEVRQVLLEDWLIDNAPQ